MLVDGESVKTCTMLAVQADGAEIRTIEGLATDGELHPMQQAFQENHGLQCGFCTPGMVMAAVSFLEENPAPTERDVRLGLEGNLCRCTGYHNIVKAVLAAADERRRRTMTAVTSARAGVLGVAMLRKEDPALLTGEARFIDDLDIPGALHLARRAQPVRPRPHLVDRHGRRGRDARRRRRAHRRRPRRRLGRADAVRLAGHRRHEDPEHCPLARDEVRYVGDGVAVVVAETPQAAQGRGRRRRRRLRRAAGGRSTSRTRSTDRVVIHDDTRHEHDLHVGARSPTRRPSTRPSPTRPTRSRSATSSSA